MNSVQGENLEDQRFALHDQEQEYRRSAPYRAAARNGIRSSALPLRLANCRSQGDVLGQDLRHFDDLLGIKHERVEETEDVWQLFHRLRHRSIEDLHHGSKADEVDNVLQGVPLDPLLRSHLDERWPPAPRRALPRTTRRTLHLPLLWTSVSVELCSPPPWPCPSSVPVGRATFHLPPPCRSCGGRLRTGLLRRSAAHVSTKSAGVAVFSATRSRGRLAASCRPPGLDRRVTKQKQSATCLSLLVVLLLLVLVVLLVLLVLVLVLVLVLLLFLLVLLLVLLVKPLHHDTAALALSTSITASTGEAIFVQATHNKPVGTLAGK